MNRKVVLSINIVTLVTLYVHGWPIEDYETLFGGVLVLLASVHLLSIIDSRVNNSAIAFQTPIMDKLAVVFVTAVTCGDHGEAWESEGFEML